MWSYLVELWAACSASANASLVPHWAHVSLFGGRNAWSGADGIVSDRYGRKKVLLATMFGNILSAIVWLRSTSFVCALRPVLHVRD